MQTQITITVTVTNITAAEMREHIEEVEDQIEDALGVFEIDLKNVTFVDSIECKEVSS